MSSVVDHTFMHYSPYIRLTKNEVGTYTLWLVTYIPDNFSIPNDPVVSLSGTVTQVSVHVESGGAQPSGNWKDVSFKIASIPVSTDESARVNATVYLDATENTGNATVHLGDPQNEGSTTIPVTDAEDE